MRQRMKNKCHYHVQESQTFCKARARGVLTVTPRRRCLTEEIQEFVFEHSPQTSTTRVVRMRYPRNGSTSDTISGVTTMRVPRT